MTELRTFRVETDFPGKSHVVRASYYLVNLGGTPPKVAHFYRREEAPGEPGVLTGELIATFTSFDRIIESDCVLPENPLHNLADEVSRNVRYVFDAPADGDFQLGDVWVAEGHPYYVRGHLVRPGEAVITPCEGTGNGLHNYYETDDAAYTFKNFRALKPRLIFREES